MKLLKYFILLASLFVFAGCTYHIEYRTRYSDIEIIKDTGVLINPNEKICIYYDDKAYIKIDARKTYKADNLAFDYGDAIKKIGKKWFSGYENIKFINIMDKAAQQKRECSIDIFPKIDEAIYTYPGKAFTTQLEVTMRFKIDITEKDKSFEKIYKSGILTISPVALSEYVYLSKVFTEWMRSQIIIAINELESTKGEPYHENN